MRKLIAVFVLAVTTIAFAADSPDAPESKQDSKAVKPSTQPAENEFPSAADLVRKMKQAQKKKDSQPKVAYFNLSKPVQEKPADFTLFGDDGALVLRNLLDRLRTAQKDKNVKAVLMTLGAQTQINFAQAQEIRDTLASIVKSGKPVYVYADGYDTPAFTMASGANHICMLEGGEMELPGVGMEVTFLKGLFDKIGVKADYVQIGEYKGADEEYTRTEASEELKGELNKLTDSLYNQIVDGISRSRNIPASKVKQLIDQTIITGKEAKEAGLVDVLTDQDGLRPLLNKELGSEVDLLNDFGRPAPQNVDLSSPFGLLSLLTKRSQPASDKPSVAII